MTPPGPPNIPPPGGEDNPRRLPRRAPRREEIETATVGVLQAGERDKADLLLIDLGDGVMVVKDFARKAWWVRLLGRIQVAREHRAYRWLERMPGVPALIGRVDGLAVAVEKVEGERLAFLRDPRARGEEHLGRLRALLDRMHLAGVVHNDLRGRENVLLCPDGGIVVLDLAGAICLEPGGVVHRLLFRALATTDEAAFLKWKEFLTPGRLTEDERAFLRRFEARRRFWPFNRKRRARGEAS